MYFDQNYFHGSVEKMLDCLSRVLDETPYNLSITDNFGRIIYANERYLNLYMLLGVSKEMLTKMSAHDFTDSGRLKSSAILNALNMRTQTINRLELGPQSKEVYYSFASPVFNESGNIEFAFNCFQSKDDMLVFIREAERQIEEKKSEVENYRAVLLYLTNKNAEPNQIVVSNSQMKRIYQQAKQVSSKDCNVILFGEFGTGKDVLAKYIHSCHETRSEYPFIPVNCSAIPADLMESEFFGYEHGAFTGASKEGKPGLFEMADKGTLFLDEIGEMPLNMQTKLLRALESKKVRRLGGQYDKTFDVRIISATNRNLFQMVKDKQFREDLYYRLNVVPFYLPPLRERKDEIGIFANYFLEIFNKEYHSDIKLSEQTMQALKEYSFPGNIRELRNMINYIVVTNSEVFGSEGRMPSAAVKSTTHELTEPQNTNLYAGTLKERIRAFEQDVFTSVIQECGGNITQSAKKLGVDRTLFYKKYSRTSQVDKHLM